jgi:hypothetical protein
MPGPAGEIDFAQPDGKRILERTGRTVEEAHEAVFPGQFMYFLERGFSRAIRAWRRQGSCCHRFLPQMTK